MTAADGRLRISPWHGDRATAYLAPVRGRPSQISVARCVEQLADGGFRAAVTPALAPPEQTAFLAAGFAVRERLHLLTRRIDALPAVAAPSTVIHRGRRSDRPAVLAVDHASFPPFWQLDAGGLVDALAATPAARLRVARHEGDSTTVGYAIVGRAAGRGYLQRLAVLPTHQHQGIGTALVVDGLRWLRRWGAREVLVNTQEGNEAAVRLYERLGFRLQPEGLAVLHRALGAGA